MAIGTRFRDLQDLRPGAVSQDVPASRASREGLLPLIGTNPQLGAAIEFAEGLVGLWPVVLLHGVRNQQRKEAFPERLAPPPQKWTPGCTRTVTIPPNPPTTVQERTWIS
jgi:hypothetical protein